MNKSIVGVIIGTIILTGCFSKKEITHTPKTSGTDDLEYLNAFTEATKHALFGNYSSAIRIYENLLKVRPESGAVNYQLSSIYMRVGNMEKAMKYGITAYRLDTTNVWYALHLANLYQYEDKLDSAAICYERVVKIRDDLEYKYNLAILYSKIGESEKALNIVHQLEKEIKESNELSYLKHNLYNNLHYTDSAIYELKEMIKREPDKTENYGLLAEYLSEMNMNTESREVYQEILKKDSLNGLLLLSYAEFLKLNKEYNEAKRYYIKAIHSDELDYDTKLGTVLLYLNNKEEFDKFKDYLGDVIEELKMEYPELKSYAASADYYIKMQDFESALEDLKVCLQFDAENVVIWEQYLYILSYEEEYELLASEGMKAMDIFPDDPGIAFYYAYGESRIGKLRESIDVLKEKDIFIKNKDLRIQYYNLLAEDYREINKNDSSDYYYVEILKIDNGNMMVRNNYGYYLSLRGKDLERAEELSRYTVEKEPENSTYLDTYGWILFKMGKVKKAYEYIDKAIKNGAENNSEVLDHFGDINYALGLCKEAIKYWKLAIEYGEEYVDINQEKINTAVDCE